MISTISSRRSVCIDHCSSTYIANVHRLASLPVEITRADKRRAKKGLQLQILNSIISLLGTATTMHFDEAVCYQRLVYLPTGEWNFNRDLIGLIRGYFYFSIPNH